MAGLALILELLSQQAPCKSSVSVHSFASFSALVAATSAVSSFGSRNFLGSVAHCEAFNEDHNYSEQKPFLFLRDEIYSKRVPEKSYNIHLRPIFSAFTPLTLCTTVLRALLLNFQPILDSYMKQADEDELEEEEEAPLNEPIDCNTALKGSGKTILREVTVVTTRRLLERVVVRHCSKRITWKLLKDLSMSAERKAGRHISKFQLFIGVQKTTFRGHGVAIAASWLVQLVLDIYSCIRRLYQRKRKLAAGNTPCRAEIEELTILGRKLVGNTLKCGASLVFASAGAGLGAVMIRPALGQWIGCMAGEMAGGIAMSILIDPWVVFGSFSAPDVD